MTDKLSKITSLIFAVLFVLALLSAGFFYYKTMTMEPVPESVIVPSEKVDWAMDRVGGSLAIYIDYTYVLLAIATVLVIVFATIVALSSKKTFLRSITRIGSLVAVILIAYIFATSEIPIFFGYEKFGITHGTALMIDLGLKTAYVLLVIAIGGVIFTGLRGYFKKS
ncbi:MAG TPA: hypothetical protein PLS84_09760 [Salinivirgaceae bacterium]|nr:hypothetical protein [Salinivirgaceae bacterium]